MFKTGHARPSSSHAAMSLCPRFCCASPLVRTPRLLTGSRAFTYLFTIVTSGTANSEWGLCVNVTSPSHFSKCPLLEFTSSLCAKLSTPGKAVSEPLFPRRASLHAEQCSPQTVLHCLLAQSLGAFQSLASFELRFLLPCRVQMQTYTLECSFQLSPPPSLIGVHKWVNIHKLF